MQVADMPDAKFPRQELVLRKKHRIQKPIPTASAVSVRDHVDKPLPPPAHPPSYDSDSARENAFYSLLNDREVPSSSEWSDALRRIVGDPRYVALRSMSAREDVFSRYKKERAAVEKEQRDKARKEAKVCFPCVRCCVLVFSS